MTSINHKARVKSRRSSVTVKHNQRRLLFEMMEQRVVLSANYLSLGQSFADPSDYRDESGFEVHALSVLPNQAADPVNPEDTLSTVTPVSLSETFLMHSNPNANHTIYLDFNGHVTSGTIWNSNYNGGQDIITPAYDFDGNTSFFSDSELQRIQGIWERVAEDFIPFDVNVTTEDPGTAALSKSGSGDSQWGARIVIGGSSNDWWGSTAGGVAYVSSFNWSSDSPGFVFEAQLGNGNEKYTAEAISHEAGHTLGLNHDGRISPSEEYFAGHGSGETGWAPIMGSSYYKNVTQWSNGEYTSASRTENDLAILSGNNGFSYRIDDHAGIDSSATPLGISNDIIRDWGIIERTTDVDVFAFSTNSGAIEINVDPLDRGPNLDVALELYDAASNLVASSIPVNAISAAISLSAAAGQYYLHVSGSGNGDPASGGYSDYASLGQYFISGTVVPVQNDFLSISAVDANKAEGNANSTDFTFVVRRTGNTSAATTVDYSVSGSGSDTAAASDFAASILPTGSLSFAAGETSKTITIQIAADLDIENDEGFTVTLSGASGDTVISNPSSDGLIINDDVPVTPGITVTPTSGLTTKEQGTTASFTVVLDSQPTADVIMQVNSLDTTEGIANINQLQFTPSNWDTPQVVTVTGIDDTIRDGHISYTIDLAASQSSDANYNGLAVDDVQLTNQDNEKGGKGKGGGGKGGGNKGPKGADVTSFNSATLVAVPQSTPARDDHEFEDEDEHETLNTNGATAVVMASEMDWVAHQQSRDFGESDIADASSERESEHDELINELATNLSNELLK